MPAPAALLLDFGGVIADAPDHPDWRAVVAEAVREVLAAAGAPGVPPDAIVAALDEDDRPTDRPKGRTRNGADSDTQPDHAAMWGERIGAGWPPAARAAVAAQGAFLSRTFIEAKHGRQWELRPGMADLLADAAGHDLPVAIVSNTLCGVVHREFLDREGLAGRFVAQFYSDEEGVRKPNPELAWRAVAAVGQPADGCWFVGDTLSRDVQVAVRAGLGAGILMRSLRPEPSSRPDLPVPDAVVADPVELRALLAAHLG